MPVDDARDALFATVRALTPGEFEQLVRLLPAYWGRTLRLEGIDAGQSGFGVLLKARWQNFPRKLRRSFAREIGASAQRLAAGPSPSPRVVALASLFGGPGGAEAQALGADPGSLAERLAGASTHAREALDAALEAVTAGHPCPEDVVTAAGAYNEAFALARTMLADRGVHPVPDRVEPLAERLEELARGGDRALLRGPLATLAAVEADLDLLRDARRAATYLLEREPPEWSDEEERLARALAAIVDLRRLAAAGATPGDVLAASRRAEPLLPDDLKSLVVLAASGGFTLPEPAAVASRGGPRDNGGSAVA